MSLHVLLNGEMTELPTGTTLAALIAQRDLTPEAVGSAVNGRHVPRAARAERVLDDGDTVTLFQPIVGG
ncbi:sulfur carrier protein ThiS [Sphaerotilus montanus]|jgi:sulfur carrier protein|uniref:Sulfur carrier protein n=1 Tax=Sphaerotilus montanus TaxID=522889 RepID=A0A7Y9QY57_9BURK|nr:sulfur carrier protein ThiS [Sphaerotilus montanus]NYG31382.1 sulfur carrier protein [Sphaerotilus montanus]NZD55363.1 sulfur carrier protein ThiS [Sphaerotilus montanus]